MCEIGMVKAQDMCLTFYQTFSDATVHFGDVPAECIARVVGHDQTILFEHQKSHRTHRQSKNISVHQVTDCLTETKDKRGSTSSGIVLLPFNNSVTEQSFKKNNFSINKKKSTEVNTRTTKLYREQGITDRSMLVVIDEMIQCKVC